VTAPLLNTQVRRALERTLREICTDLVARAFLTETHPDGRRRIGTPALRAIAARYAPRPT